MTRDIGRRCFGSTSRKRQVNVTSGREAHICSKNGDFLADRCASRRHRPEGGKSGAVCPCNAAVFALGWRVVGRSATNSGDADPWVAGLVCPCRAVVLEWRVVGGGVAILARWRGQLVWGLIAESPSTWEGDFVCLVCGGVLVSHTLSGVVPSPLRGLASGFGMGPGVSPALCPPQNCFHLCHSPTLWLGWWVGCE